MIDSEKSALLTFNPILDTIISFRSFVHPPPPSRSDHPPWTLKQGGLESSGQQLVSLNSKAKKISFYLFCKKMGFKERKKVFFWDYYNFSDVRLFINSWTCFGILGFLWIFAFKKKCIFCIYFYLFLRFLCFFWIFTIFFFFSFLEIFGTNRY